MGAPATDPLVSVIVPTFDRREAALRCLGSLIDQDLPGASHEIIIVDDGSTDGTAEAAGDLGRTSGREVRVIRQPRRGPAAARNAGASAARGEILAFIDADAIADPAWLREVLRHLEDGDLAGIEGRTVIPEGGGGGPLGWRTENIAGGRYLGCNLVIRRRPFEEAGGFDDRFGRVPFREDTDLARRIEAAGGRIAWAPSAVVYHPVAPGSWRTPLEHAWRYRNDPLLLAKDWRHYLLRVDVRRIGPVPIWKPRPVLYGTYLAAIPSAVLIGSVWPAAAVAASLLGILVLHLRGAAPGDVRPGELLVLVLACALVPLVFLAAIVAGTVRLLSPRVAPRCLPSRSP